MADARVDILLALRTQLDGLQAGRAALRGFGGDLQQVNAQAQRSATTLDGDFDKVITSLRKKFTAAKLGEALLGGVGIGTALAVVNLTVEKWKDIWQAAEKHAAAVQERAEKIAAAMREVREARYENFLAQQDPETQLRLRQAEFAAKQREIEAQRAKEATAMSGMARVEQAGATNPLGLSNVGVNVREWGGEKFGGEAGMGGRTFWEEMNKRADEARLKAVQLEKEAEAIRAKIIALEEAKNKAAHDQMESEFKQLEADMKREVAEDAKTRVEAAEALTQESQRADEAVKKLNDSFTKQAQSYRELADPQAKFKKQLAEIDALSRMTGKDGKAFLSEAEAATAKARVLAEMNDTVGKALAAAREEVGGFDRALQVLDANPYLTDNEKHAQRVHLIEAQAAAIAKLKKELQDLAKDNPAMAAQIGGEIRSLDDAGARGAAKSFGPAGALDSARTRYRGAQQGGYQSAGDALQGGALNYLAQSGTQFDQLANGITSGVGTAVNNVTSGITAWATGAGAFGDMLKNLRVGVLQSMLQTIIQMGTQWLMNAALVKTGLISIEATGDALRTARVVKENTAEAATLPAKTAGAAASGISSFGAALAFGALAVALIASLAGGFSTGGFTGGTQREKPAGIVHEGEWVAPQWMVQDPQYAGLISVLEAARTGSEGYSLGGFVRDALFKPYKMAARDWVPGGKFAAKHMDKYNLLDGRGIYGQAQTGTWGYDFDSKQWVAEGAGSASQATAAAAQAGGSNSRGGSDSRQFGIALVDQRDSDVVERLMRDPRGEAWVVGVLDRNRLKFGIRT